MGKILGIDYGIIMTGLSITDNKKIFAFGLKTIFTKDIFIFLREIFYLENIEKIVIGDPKTLYNKSNEIEKNIKNFMYKFRKKYPKIPIRRLDERFTSKIAYNTIINSGINRKKRKNKTILNKISSIIILQSFLKLYNNK